ncbi:hypothetical protein OPV22_008993 [Ensete ventricosum]|uniref:OST48 middle domain-containing protein n=1 Tax=Ensete ventricosum TaxID=4639 RepID=A0AAV8RE10_ENSVE|nr:hypothetical protein OPV22_008993 [Ensete ventricosum]
MYQINDDLEYSVEIYEQSVLKTLSTDQKGLFSTSFKVPDVYGVFQFKVDHQKLGYTSLSLSKQIPCQPLWHNENEIFITTAFPYYRASFSPMAGFFIFTILYL